jgi:fatty acid amide hydrolase
VSEITKIEIVHANLLELKKFLESGKYSSETISKVLLLRNYEYLEFNYAADINVEETMTLAKKADEIRKSYKDQNKLNDLELKYPLLGLPLSIKDVFLIKNFVTTQGYACNLDFPASTSDSYIIEILKEKGAIPLLMSSVPQGIYAIETNNLIYGRAANPFNKNKIIGGSSGGEAGLISQHCSAAGIGSDIGGSIRIPSSFCGIFGFKPTSSRVSKVGTWEQDNLNVKSAFHLVRVSYGPMARSIDDIIFLSQNILGSFQKDCCCNNIVFENALLNKTIEKRVLKIAILKSDITVLTEPVSLVLNDVIEGLKKNKQNYEITVEDFPFQNFTEFVLLAFKFVFSSRTCNNLLAALKDEYPMPHFKNFQALASLPNCFRKMLSFFLWIGRSKRMKMIIDKTNGNIGLKEFLDDVRRMEQLKDEIVKTYIINKYDAIISPVSPFPVLKHNDSSDLILSIDYPIIFSYLDFPSGVIPIRKSKKPIKKYEDLYNDIITKKIRENLEDSDGLPIGIQVSTLPNQDEVCLGIMKTIDSILKEEKISENLTILK